VEEKNQFEAIRELISQGNIDTAIQALEEVINNTPSPSDEAYYLLGNAYRKLGNWQLALNNYMAAAEINPDSPAVEAKNMVMDILNFYNKDMFNQ